MQVSHSDSGSGSGILRDSLRGNISFVDDGIGSGVVVLGPTGASLPVVNLCLLLLLGYPGGRMPGAKVLERVGFC